MRRIHLSLLIVIAAFSWRYSRWVRILALLVAAGCSAIAQAQERVEVAGDAIVFEGRIE
jgi:hypothetical protein